jgi:hypothetical protein
MHFTLAFFCGCGCANLSLQNIEYNYAYVLVVFSYSTLQTLTQYNYYITSFNLKLTYEVTKGILLSKRKFLVKKIIFTLPSITDFLSMLLKFINSKKGFPFLLILRIIFYCMNIK